MITRLTNSPAEAAAFIKGGGIVAFPTETVYGLGADVFNDAAIRKVFDAKQRPADNPLIAHVAEAGDINLLSERISPAAQRLVDAFFPGPLTLVLPKSASVPLLATAGLNTIGIRMPEHPTARAFLRSCAVPIVAPSANLSGRPSPTTWQAVFEDLYGRVDCILQGDPTEIGIESTVVDCSVDPPAVLRKGAVSIEQLREVVPAITDWNADAAGLISRSPGMRHRHYTPAAEVIILERQQQPEGTERDAYIGLSPRLGTFKLMRVCSTPEEYASSLFEFFRECDRAGIVKIFCESVKEEGIGAALMDRIRRASGTG